MSNFEINMMLTFLQRNYPVSRIKDNGRFKRAIVLDDGYIYHLSQETQHRSLKNQLIQIVKNIFYCDDETSMSIVKTYLNIK